MSNERLKEELARELGWKVAPDRFIKSGRCWIPKWRFSPIERVEDAFLLLDRIASAYRLEKTGQGGFVVEVQARGKIGKAYGESKARTITLAIAQALGLEVPK